MRAFWDNEPMKTYSFAAVILFIAALIVAAILSTGCQSRTYSYEVMDPSTGKVVSKVNVDIQNSNVKIGTLRAEKKVDDQTVVSIEVSDLTAEERMYEWLKSFADTLNKAMDKIPVP